MDQKVMELDINCINHSSNAFSAKEIENLVKDCLNDYELINSDDFISGDYNYFYCKNCNKWIKEEDKITKIVKKYKLAKKNGCVDINKALKIEKSLISKKHKSIIEKEDLNVLTKWLSE